MKKLFTIVFCLFLLTVGVSQPAKDSILTQADTLRGMLSPLRTCYNVLVYDLDVKVDINDKYISGCNTIKLIAENDFQKLQIDLFENMQIQLLEFETASLSYSRKFNAVFIDFPRMIKKGEIISFKIYYRGKPQPAIHPPWDGGFSWEKDIDGNPWVGVSCQQLGASCWWPCKDHQSDEPDEMFISIAVPSDLTAVSNGRLIKKTDLQDGYTKYDWHVSYPINNYDVTLNIAKYNQFSDVYVNALFKDTLTLDYFVLPYNYEKAKTHFKQVKPMLDCYYKLMGEYPFVKDGYKLVETPYLGMEHQSCISYGNNYKSGYRGKDLSGAGFDFDYIIIHESAHEWWGNAITTNDIADMWIHEGFGTYSEALYVECMYGHDAYLKYINAEKKSVGNKEPIIGKYNVNKPGSRDMYPKGALLIHTIRSIINNDTLFFTILEGLQLKYKYKTVNSSDIEKYISEKSGIDLSQVFNVYLHEKSIPKLEYIVEKNGRGLKLSYRYVSDKPFTMPVKATLKKDILSFIYPTDQWQTIKIDKMKEDDFKVALNLFYIDVEKKLK
jgi:aminopeptidase N